MPDSPPLPHNSEIHPSTQANRKIIKFHVFLLYPLPQFVISLILTKANKTLFLSLNIFSTPTSFSLWLLLLSLQILSLF